MNKTQMDSLAERLEKMAEQADKMAKWRRENSDLEDSPNAFLRIAAGYEAESADLRAAARCVRAMAKMQAGADMQVGWDWNCRVVPGTVRLEYGYWKNQGHSTALEAIEAQP